MRSMSPKTGLLFALTLGLAGSTLRAQAPPAPAAPPKPDTPAVTQHVNLARKAAGTEWTQAVEFICKVNPDRANRADDPLIAPTKIFDNVYAIGRTGTVVYAITTSAGIVLIDAGYADQLDTVLLPGLKAVGLDPNNVRYILLGHGHGNHFGGAAYFQDKGARVALAGGRLGPRRSASRGPRRRARPGRPQATEARSRGGGGAGHRGRRRDFHAGRNPGSHAGRTRLHLSGQGRRTDAHGGPLWRLHPDSRPHSR